MSAGTFTVPSPPNEAVRSYAPGSAERASIEAELLRQASNVVEIPCVIGGERIFTGHIVDVTMPCVHGHVLAKLHCARPRDIDGAVSASMEARREWAHIPAPDYSNLALARSQA